MGVAFFFAIRNRLLSSFGFLTLKLNSPFLEKMTAKQCNNIATKMGKYYLFYESNERESVGMRPMKLTI